MHNNAMNDNETDLFGLADLANQVVPTDKQTEFFNKNFHLPWNPFPEPGVPAPEVTDVAGIRKEEFKKIGHFIRDAYQRPFKSKNLVVRGQYGSGKSMILKNVVSRVNKLFSGKGEESAKAVYVSRPSFEAQALNRAILESLGMDNVRKMLWVVIKKAFAEDLKTHTEELKQLWGELSTPNKKGIPRPQGTLFKEDAWSQVFQPVFDPYNIDDYRYFLSKYDRQGWNRAHLRKYFTGLLTRGTGVTSSTGVLYAYVDLLLALDDSEAWESLMGLEARKPGAKRDFALRFLEDLLRILSANGFAYLFLVIDEFEQVTEGRLLTARERNDYGYTILEVINQITKGLGIVLGISEEGFQRLSEIAPLSDRLVGSVELKDLKSEEIAVLLQYYIDQARSESKDYKRYTGKLTPFSEEIVENIANEIRTIVLGATPRNVLQFAYHFLEHCAAKGYATLSPQIVKEFIPIYRQMKARETPSRRRGR